MINMVVLGVALALGSYLCDRHGRTHLLMGTAAIALASAYPLWMVFELGFVAAVGFSQLMLAVVAGMALGGAVDAMAATYPKGVGPASRQLLVPSVRALMHQPCPAVHACAGQPSVGGPAPHALPCCPLPLQVRCTGLSLSHSLSSSLAGGLAPALAVAIIRATGNMAGPAFVMMFAALVGAAGAWACRGSERRIY
jgi:hypothetical protein